MPNWMEGTLRLRGKTEDILRFFREGINVYQWNPGGDLDDYVQQDRNVWYHEEDYSDGYYIYFENVDPYIEDTKRACLNEQEIYIDKTDGIITVPVLAQQAWAFNVEDFVKLSKKFNLDIRGFGGERGMCFCQEFMVIQGEKISDQTIHYNDWNWDSPFPLNGG